MSLTSIYRKLRESIVAFVPKYSVFRGEKPTKLDFPPIIGTGFIVHEDGLIATNAHVVRCFKNIFKPKEAPEDEWPVDVLLLALTDDGMVEVHLDILGIFSPCKFDHGEIYYGPKEGPDLAFVQVKSKGLPPVALDSLTPIEEGTEIGTAGFPMGTDMLTAPGWLHQITPTVQNGIIAAVHPFFSTKPHSYSINIMVQGGASGSPVFSCDSGKVIGIVASAIYDRLLLEGKTPYWVPTNISYAVPSHYICHSVERILSDNPDRIPLDTETLDQMFKTYRKVVITPKEGRPVTVKKIKFEDDLNESAKEI